MVSVPDYNPNYEERRGQYTPDLVQANRQNAGHAHGERQNAAMTNDEQTPEPRLEEQAENRNSNAV
jgi:hypothetical protein